jgi:hypothetical protein
MRELPNKLRLFIAGVIALGILFLSFYTEYPLGGEKPKSEIHKQALESFNKKAYKEALVLIEKDYEALLEEKEGCELVISIFATNQKLSSTENASKKCMERGKALGMAQEAYAMSMASVGKSAEAVTVLNMELQKHDNARVHAAIAQLHVFENDKKKAQKHLLRAIEIGDPWSTWLMRVFTSKTFTEDRVFLRNLVPVINAKKDVVADAEFKLVHLLQKHKLTLEEQVMMKRLRKRAEETSGQATPASTQRHSEMMRSHIKSK